MSIAIRDAFVHLHSSQVLENLLKEFKERYKGYKLPVSAFTSRIVRTSVLRGGRNPAVERLLSGLDIKEEAEEEEVAEEVEEQPEEEEAPVPRARGRPKTRIKSKDIQPFDPNRKRTSSEKQEIEDKLRDRFVNLLDVLPPIPEKGKFNIEVIKDSQYFFS
ncbi:DNA-directed RNA polymerase [Serendipita sp. 399]|nr:DNA-directed RNA polymerase [Serendipita sp. 399]